MPSSVVTTKCAHCGEPMHLDFHDLCDRSMTKKCTHCGELKDIAKWWTYSVPFEPHSYWLSLGHDHAYANIMEQFQDQFKEAVDRMRKEKRMFDVIFNHPLLFRRSNIDGNTTVILHDEALLPHWREVALALEIHSVKLRKRQQESLKTPIAGDSFMDLACLSADDMKNVPRDLRFIFEDTTIGAESQFVIDKVELRKEVIDIIAPPLAQSPFTSIILEYNRFDREGIAFAADLLKQRSVSSYSLIGSSIECEEDLNLLSSIISTHPSLRELSLAHCASPTTNNPARFNPIISAGMGLKILDLSGNNVESVVIADNLATNPPLKELRLRSNNFNDDDAEILANSLKTNTNLWKLDLKENSDIGRRGCTAVLKAIFNYENLNSISSSNHTCDILVSRYKIPSINGEAWGGEEGAIRAKKLAILAPPGKQDVNVGLLRGAPPELMHMVLKFVQVYPEQHWMHIEHLLRCKDLLESTNYDEGSTDLIHDEDDEDETGFIHDEDEDEAYFFREDEVDDDMDLIEEELFEDGPGSNQRQREEISKDELEKLVKIKSLSVLMSVVKGVVVPIFFSA